MATRFSDPVTWGLQLGAQHLAACGPRAVFEFLIELAAAHGISDEIVERLSAWRKVSPELVQRVLVTTAAGRQFPPNLSLLPARP